MARLNFPDSVKTAALKRACFTCEAPDCGQTAAWREFRDKLAALQIPPWPRPCSSAAASLGFLAKLGERARVEAGRQPYHFKQLDMARYRLTEGPDALLQVDHIREVADFPKGTPASVVCALDNAQVLCIVCHLDKTATRGRVRRKGPQVAKKYELLRRVG